MAQARDLEYYLAQARRIAAHREAGAEEEIRKEFNKLRKELNAYIAGVHEKYAQGDGSLTFADLQKAGYDARFLEEIEKRISVATPRVAKKLHQLVSDTYELAYKSMVEGVQKVAEGADIDEVFKDAEAIRPEQIKAAVSSPFMENALLKNHQTIIYDIRQAVAVGLMNGDRYNTIAQKITVALGKETGPYKNAVLIARTETHRVREAGNHDAALKVDEALQKGTTGMRMCKTWKTMNDERVRPQYVRKRKKGGWSKGINKRAANHMILKGQTVLENEPFDLGHYNGQKVEAMMPGSSGIAGHDCNCRCYASREMLTDEEYFKKTGKHFPGYTGEDKPEETAEAVKPEDMTRKQMREKIKEDRERIVKVKSDIRDVELDIAEHKKTVFDDLKGLKKSDISGRIKEIEEREKIVNPLVDRYYNRPARGTPEYEKWREWKQGIDTSALIDEQMRLATEKAALNSKLRRYERYEAWEKWKAEHPLDKLEAKKKSMWDDIKRLEDEIKAFQERLEANVILSLADKLEDAGVVKKAVTKHAKKLTQSEIINALAGGDKTQGSCASVGLAYIGQRQGWNVLDFRDGTSRAIFANSSALKKLSTADGLKVHLADGASSMTVGNRLLKKVEVGKEYYLCVGRHAAIVRKTEEGTLQYLELQSARYSGWTDFNANPKYTLKSRFGCTQSSSSAADYDFMLDIDESNFDTDDFKELFSFLNTAESEQRKGTSGTIK